MLPIVLSADNERKIVGFGGDPDNVTIFGESAGAGSVSLLPLIKGSHAYIRRVIAQSGSPTLTRSTEQAVECTNEMMDILGCKTVADLQKVDARRFVKEAEAIVLRVAPERDGKYLPADPHKAYADGAAKDIAFLLGCNKDEMAWFVSVMGEEGFKEWAADRKAKRLVKLTDDERKRVESFCNDVKGEDPEPDSRLIEQIWFNTPTVRMSENLTKCGGKSHTYFFTVNPSLPFVHGEELTIVFNHPEMEEERKFDETFSRTVRRMWVQFAKTGDPSLSADISPDGKAKEWPLYDLKDKRVMVFDETDIHPEKESEIRIVDWERTYFLTDYYLF